VAWQSDFKSFAKRSKKKTLKTKEPKMEFKEILYEEKGPVAVITLNRPDRMNALTMLTHRELEKAIDIVEKDEKIRVVVLTGAGRGFCSGDDVQDIFLDPEDNLTRDKKARLQILQRKKHSMGGAHRLVEINKPSIAAVNGAAVGYGCDMSLMCHMRIASEKARFGEVFLRVGLLPDAAMILLPRLVGTAKTYEMILTTDIIDAKEAERIGLVNKVVPHEQLMSATMELAEKIASKPPISVQLAIEGVRRGVKMPLPEYMEWHAQAFMVCAETEDHIEGSKAFMEKRPPVFKGK
jgi:enoyl-CoA hydratase/carnithine racemase